MIRYFMEPRIGKYAKGYGFLSLARNLSDKYGKNYWLLIKNRTRCCGNCLQNSNP